MSLDTTMVSIHPHFTIKDGKMDQCIAIKGTGVPYKIFKTKLGCSRV